MILKSRDVFGHARRILCFATSDVVSHPHIMKRAMGLF